MCLRGRRRGLDGGEGVSCGFGFGGRGGGERGRKGEVMGRGGVGAPFGAAK